MAAQPDPPGDGRQPDHRKHPAQVKSQAKEEPIIMARWSENAFFANFSTYDAPLPTKVRLALANSWRKVRTRSGCCGNNGQPGC
jgi:hypothetical protein